jgi:hypothetical protein
MLARFPQLRFVAPTGSALRRAGLAFAGAIAAVAGLVALVDRHAVNRLDRGGLQAMAAQAAGARPASTVPPRRPPDR